MKRALWFLTFLVLAVFLFTSVSAIAYPNTDPLVSGDTIVYVTRTGSKYHRDGCSSLSRSKIEITLKEAVEEGYEPCKRCKPPRL
ncbi:MULTISPECIES: Ada metal-binding domain-containing protein [Synergistaceae]|uniref:Ada metal-binding domain-containing protein n=1 Tax=Synergistaceae TaxID=649777 RepID=UPI003ADB50CB|nr:hypothetical protein [Synergistaceae bacterium DZ-S4]